MHNLSLSIHAWAAFQECPAHSAQKVWLIILLHFVKSSPQEWNESECHQPNITYLLMSMAIHCFVLGNSELFEGVKNTRNQIWSILRTHQTTLQTMECAMESIFSWGMQMRKHRDRAIKSLDSPLPPPAYGRKLEQNQVMSLLGGVWLLTSKTMESQAILRLDWEATSTFP